MRKNSEARKVNWKSHERVRVGPATATRFEAGVGPRGPTPWRGTRPSLTVEVAGQVEGGVVLRYVLDEIDYADQIASRDNARANMGERRARLKPATCKTTARKRAPKPKRGAKK